MQPVEFANLTNRKDSSLPHRASYSPIQLLFVKRLEQLLVKRRQYAGRLSGGDWRLKLIDLSLYSTYCDCMDLGLHDEARTLLQRSR